MAVPASDFEPDFASPAQWAGMYRACGLQVVPAKEPIRGGSWKMPALAHWADLQERLIPQEAFDRWYAQGGGYVTHRNMGVLTGRCSGNLFVLDLDDQKGPEAQGWWNALLEVHASGIDPETVEQRTGGGGRQKLFRAPKDWIAPTNKTALNVDIRGQGGFAMMPPSAHESGRDYEWLPGRAPWETEIADAPEWLLEALEALVARHGSRPRIEKTTSPDAEKNAFGTRIINGRETYARDMIWRVVLEMYRASPIPPGQALKERDEAWQVYESCVASRLPEEAGVSNADLLERENRGRSMFNNKWRREMRNWGSPRMQEKAAEIPLDKDPATEFQQTASKAEEQAKVNTAKQFEYLDIAQIKTMPDPKWLVDKLIVEHALGFIYGPPGCLKTFIALDLALHFATKKPAWWGRPIERSGAVIYISSEGQADLKFRIMAWETQRETNADQAPFFLIRQSINFMRAEDIGTLLATVEAIAAKAGPIAAVFVDTVSRVLPGAEENLQKDMTIFVTACDAVRLRFGATVIGLHHTSKAGAIRGSTVIPGAGDFMIEMRREPGAMEGSFYVAKLKAGRDGWEQHFTVAEVQLGELGAITSLVMDPADPQDAASGRPDHSLEQRIFYAITEAWASGKPWSSSPQSGARYAVRIMEVKFGMPARTAKEWIERNLIERRLVDELYDSRNKVVGLKVV